MLDPTDGLREALRQEWWESRSPRACAWHQTSCTPRDVCWEQTPPALLRLWGRQPRHPAARVPPGHREQQISRVQDTSRGTQHGDSPSSSLLRVGKGERGPSRRAESSARSSPPAALPPPLLLTRRFLLQLEARVSKQLLRGCSHSIPALLRHGK